MATEPGQLPHFASLYAGDLHPEVTEAMLYKIFNAIGPVASIRVCRDSVTRTSLGYGYINFHNVSDAERALEMLNYTTIRGRSCRLMWSQRDPSQRKGSAAGNLYVKNLDEAIDNKALYDTFSVFGTVLSCKVASDSMGKSFGYGFVHYETEDVAKQAIERMNGMKVGEKTIQVVQCVKRGDKGKPDVDNFTNLYVKNFPAEWDESRIREEFGVFGTITSMVIRTDNKDRRFAFINFESSEMAQACVEALHMKEMRRPEEVGTAEEEGRDGEPGNDGEPAGKLYVQRAQSKSERQAELRGKFSKGKDARQSAVSLYVKNLDDDTDAAALRALFEPFGDVTSASVPTDARGRCKGFGFVCFASPDDAANAVSEMHLKLVNGKPLYINLAEKREARQERFKQQYSSNPGMPGRKGGPKGGMGSGMDGKGCAMAPMFGGGGQGGQMGPMPAQSMGMMGKGGPQMMGKGGPQMMGMVPPQMMGMMPPQMMGLRPGMMMGPRGTMMGGPQMMGMMGKGGPGMMPGAKNGLGGMMGMTGMGPMGGPMAGGPMAGGPMAGNMRMMRGPMRMPMGMMPNAKGGPGSPGMACGQRPAMPQPQVPLNGPLTASALAEALPSVQKQMIGGKLFPAISKYQPEKAGKITGMMLEMDNAELLALLESEQLLKAKVEEALRVLESAKPP